MMELISDIYKSAKHGYSSNLERLLCSFKSKPKDRSKLIEHKTKDGDQITTPLIIASINGHIKCVKILLSYDADIEARGTVKTDDHIIEETPALWAAAAKGEMDIVKLLIEGGGNVDARTKTNSTPLRATAYDGRIDIVSYLVEHGADVNANTNTGSTPLMIACYKGHRNVVNYLVEKGAKINTQDNNGDTALHYAVEGGQFDVVKDLVAKGASELPNNFRLTPLLLASNFCKVEIVEYFISRPVCSKLEEIDSLELLGATIANSKPPAYDIDKSHVFMFRGMNKRYIGDKCVIKKEVLPPIKAYENRVECQTKEELRGIQHDAHAIHMEGLLVRERILGSNKAELRFPIVYRGAVFADSANFEPCISLWKHAMEIGQKNNMVIVDDLERFAGLFCDMIRRKVVPSFSDVLKSLEDTVQEYEKLNQKIQKSDENKLTTLKEHLEKVMHVSLYLLTIFEHLNLTESEENSLQQLLYKYLCMNPRTKQGKTLVHLAVSGATPTDGFHIKDVCTYPCYKTTKLLLQTGAQVNTVDNDGKEKGAKINAQDKQGNTALHEAVAGGHIDIVKDLVAKGASQLPNNLSFTPLLLASNDCKVEMVEYFISTQVCSKLEEIQSLELLGATIANSKPPAYDIDKSFEFMMRGMNKRYEGDEYVIKKEVLPPIKAYQNRVECQTKEELRVIQHDAHAIHMEGLVVRERILGLNNAELRIPIMYRGTQFADSSNFEPCISLWKHAIEIGQKNNLVIVNDLERFAGLFCDMIRRKVVPSFSDVLKSLEDTVQEYENLNQKIQKSDENKLETLKDDLESVMHVSLYLLTIFEHLNLTESEENSLQHLLCKYLCMNPRTKQGKTLVHLAVSSITPTVGLYIKDVCAYPCYKTTKFLLQTGVRVNTVDNDGNTPLHTAVMTKPKQGQQEMVEKIISSLFEAGIHEDSTNADGKTAVEISSTEELKEFVILKRKIVLKCLAARAIKHYELHFAGLVPKSMEMFINAH